MACNSGCNNQSFLRHISRYVGETVIIFTASGGLSGCGFTGVVLAVNCDFVRLVTDQGSAPASPFNNGNCGFDDTDNGFLGNNGNNNSCHSVGSVCDIPVDKIVAFVHNAV